MATLGSHGSIQDHLRSDPGQWPHPEYDLLLRAMGTGPDGGTCPFPPVTGEDHTLLSFRFSYVVPLCRGARPICEVCPWQLMAPSRFQRKLGLSQGPCCMVLPNSWWCPETRGWLRIWTGLYVVFLDPLLLTLPAIHGGVFAFWAGLKRHIQNHCRKMRDDSNLTWLRAAIKAYLVAVRVAKLYYFSIFIASAECCPAILF